MTYVYFELLEILKQKLLAARQKQQESYNQFIQENGAVLKELNEKLEKERKNSDNNKKSKQKAENLFTNRDYFPLMGGGSGSSYKPARKLICGSGGCGQ